jgi:hypothetical protein
MDCGAFGGLAISNELGQDLRDGFLYGPDRVSLEVVGDDLDQADARWKF